jgi:hypothetical protein
MSADRDLHEHEYHCSPGRCGQVVVSHLSGFIGDSIAYLQGRFDKGFDAVFSNTLEDTQLTLLFTTECYTRKLSFYSNSHIQKGYCLYLHIDRVDLS